jgi:hypothetical protein
MAPVTHPHVGANRAIPPPNPAAIRKAVPESSCGNVYFVSPTITS